MKLKVVEVYGEGIEFENGYFLEYELVPYSDKFWDDFGKGRRNIHEIHSMSENSDDSLIGSLFEIDSLAFEKSENQRGSIQISDVGGEKHGLEFYCYSKGTPDFYPVLVLYKGEEKINTFDCIKDWEYIDYAY